MDTMEVIVRNTAPQHFDRITELCRRVYPDTPAWNAEQLSSHLRVFPEGQFVAVFGPDETVVGHLVPALLGSSAKCRRESSSLPRTVAAAATDYNLTKTR